MTASATEVTNTGIGMEEPVIGTSKNATASMTRDTRFLYASARIRSMENSMVTDGCRIAGHVKHSILFSGVSVEEGAEIEDAVVMGGTVIKKGASVKHCIVAENVVIGENAVVGEMPKDGAGSVATIGSGVYIGDGAKVGPAAMIDQNVKDGEEQW